MELPHQLGMKVRYSRFCNSFGNCVGLVSKHVAPYCEVEKQLHATGDAELFEGLKEVVLCGVFAQMKDLCDLAVRFPGRSALDHVKLGRAVLH